MRARRFPAEWERHDATWLGWPSDGANWPRELDAAQDAVVAMVAALVPAERVHVVVSDPTAARDARKRLGNLPAQIHELGAREVWLRDTAPSFVRDGAALGAVDWIFDGWGGRHPDAKVDDAIAARVAELCGASRMRSSLALEGGGLESDGAGTLLAGEACVLGRNPGISRADVEAELRALLGAERIVWLRGALDGDDTDGHVDTLSRFVAPGLVAVPRAEDGHADESVLGECRARLVAARDARGRPFELVDLPHPPPVELRGRRLPASYANFYVGNGAVLVPTFDVATDAEALETLGGLFPGRRPTPVPARALLVDGGACHCLTQQVPAL